MRDVIISNIILDVPEMGVKVLRAEVQQMKWTSLKPLEMVDGGWKGVVVEW